MRAIVIMNRRAMTGPPAQHEHLDKFIPAHAMTKVVTILKSNVGL
jgi:hypothetical protein